MAGPTHNPYSAYSKATHTVAKTRQIVMLYDGAIRFVQQAKEAIAEKRIEDRYHLLMKASSIVVGLQSCLDFEEAEAAAESLYSFYASLDARIIEIQRSNDAEECDGVIEELKEMRQLWHQIDTGELKDESLEHAAVDSSHHMKAPERGDELSSNTVMVSA